MLEAIESVKTRYKVDPDRIVLRGFSMGGAGAWHLGLHYPDQWAAVEAGAGFAETKVHAKVPDPPVYAHIYDAIDYAANAFNVPTVGYGGEIDPQRRASILIREELEHEGYKFAQDGYRYTTGDMRALFLIGPQTQHKWHPDSKKESDAFVARYQTVGRVEQSKQIFVTYTERYNQCFRITVDQLSRRYTRAEAASELQVPVVRVKTSNVSRITVRGAGAVKSCSLDGQSFPLKSSATFEQVNGSWRPAGTLVGLQKIHGLQGPIDDAFMEPFLCVRSKDGQPQLDRFAQEFARFMRGDVRIRNGGEVTPSDMLDYNIVLFGSPASSPAIEKVIRASPMSWTRETITVGKRKFDASTHILSMIYPNPSNPRRYAVINSGHTFHEADFKGTNALLYPRVGDWAVTNIETGKVVAEGVFDRTWRLAEN